MLPLCNVKKQTTSSAKSNSNSNNNNYIGNYNCIEIQSEMHTIHTIYYNTQNEATKSVRKSALRPIHVLLMPNAWTAFAKGGEGGKYHHPFWCCWLPHGIVAAGWFLLLFVCLFKYRLQFRTGFALSRNTMQIKSSLLLLLLIQHWKKVNNKKKKYAK